MPPPFCADSLPPMGLIAAIVDKSGQYPPPYIREKLAQYPLLRDQPLDVQLATVGHTHLLAVTTQTARIRPLFLQTPRGYFLGTGYFRSQTQQQINSTNLSQHLDLLEDLPLTAWEGEFIHFRQQGVALHVVNDRFAARPCFVLENAEVLMVSTDLSFLRHLLRTPSLPDSLGLFQLFTLEHTLGAQTQVQGMTKLLPGTLATIVDGKLAHQTYWKLEHQPLTDAQVPDRTQKVAEAMRAGTQWREALYAGQTTSLSLSGGLDSRLVAASLANPQNCEAFTIGTANSREVQVAQQVAQALGLPHVAFTLEEGPLAEIVHDLALLTGGLLPVHHPATTLRLNAQVAERHAVTFGGGPGDVLAGSYVPNAWFLTAPIEQALALYAQQRLRDMPLLKQFFRPEVFAHCAPQLHKSLLESLHSTPGPTAAHRVTAWAMAVRQPSFTFLGPSSQSDQLLEISPHLDYAYADLMLQLPAEHLYHKNFYKRMLFEQFPLVQHIAYANTGAALDGKFAATGKLPQLLGQLETQMAPIFSGHLRERIMALHGALERQLGPQQAYSFFTWMSGDRALLADLRERLEHPQIRELLDLPATLKFVQRAEQHALQHRELSAKFLGNLLALAHTVGA